MKNVIFKAALRYGLLCVGGIYILEMNGILYSVKATGPSENFSTTYEEVTLQKSYIGEYEVVRLICIGAEWRSINR